jgi:site-specific DNA recombinase
VIRAALYARFSTDRQSDTSIEAQARLCRARAAVLGLEVVAEHADQAVSGSVPLDHRPGGRALLADALAHRFDVLLVESLDRLSRDSDEQGRIVKRLVFRGIRVVGVSIGFDTNERGHKLVRGMRGLIDEVYLDDLRDKVHRSLSAKAARGGHVAGLSYGYRSEARGDDRALVIVLEQADIVREIFDRYGAGESCQRIAADLNRRGVRGPRGGTWSVSALYGSPAKGAGILNNALYVGRYVWNRSQWTKDPDTGRRTRMDRPRAEWQTDERPDLRIVTDAAFEAVQARIGGPGTRGTYRKGAQARTLFGGLLRCGRCGGAMIAVDARSYGCAARKDRGPAVCTGTLAPRALTDARLLAAIRDELAGPATIAQVRAHAARLLADHAAGQSAPAARVSSLRREIANIVDALARVGVSDALTDRLARAEAELRTLERASAAPAVKPPSVDAVVAVYRSLLLNLAAAIAGDVERARAALAQVCGPITVEQAVDGVYAEMETRPDRVLLAMTGAQLGSVAGAGFGTRLRTCILRRAA